MTHTTTDAAEARARALEALARTYEEDNLHDTAWHVREGGLNGHEQRAVRAVMLATAEAASGAGEAAAFKRGAEAMQRALADALRDHLNSRAAAIANGIEIPEYRP